MYFNKTNPKNRTYKRIIASFFAAALITVSCVFPARAELTDEQQDNIRGTVREAIMSGQGTIEIILPINIVLSDDESVYRKQVSDYIKENRISECVLAGAKSEGVIIKDLSYKWKANASQSEITVIYNSTRENLIEGVEEVSTEKQAYYAALDALKNRLYNLCFTSDTDYSYTFELALRQHPEYDYLTSMGTTGFYSSDLKIWRFSSEKFTASKVKKMMKKADKKATKIVKSIIKKTMSDEEKIKAIHDYIAKNCEYSDAKNTCRTAYGCLVEKKAVCQGYAAAFNLLASKAKIESIAVTGTATNSVGKTQEHAWNLVRINGNYYHVDVTWDDPVRNGTSAGSYVRYNYLMVEDEVLSKTHDWISRDYVGKFMDYSQ